MARSKSILSFEGTFQNITYVNSPAYGKHIRAARGTYKPAVLNEALKKEGQLLVDALVPAKMIKDALEPYRYDFHGGQMWQRLVSIFKKQLKNYGHPDFHALSNFEIYKEYPLARFISIRIDTLYDIVNNILTATLRHLQPVFAKTEYLTGYRLGLIAIFPNADEAPSEVTYTEIISRSEPIKDIVLKVSVPPGSSIALLCVKFEGCEHQTVLNTPATKGMAIIKVKDLRE